MTSGYFILEDGVQKGPFTFDEIIDAGLDVHTRISAPGTTNWQDACDLPEFYPYFESHGIYLPTGDNLASFGWRLLAFIIDWLVLSFINALIFSFLATRGISFKLSTIDDMLNMPAGKLLLIQFISSFTLILYNACFEASSWKGTIGKYACRLVVVDAYGFGQHFPNALLRGLGKAFSVAFLYLGFLSVLFTEHRQAVHDMLAKTYVVKRS